MGALTNLREFSLSKSGRQLPMQRYVERFLSRHVYSSGYCLAYSGYSLGLVHTQRSSVTTEANLMQQRIIMYSTFRVHSPISAHAVHSATSSVHGVTITDRCGLALLSGESVARTLGIATVGKVLTELDTAKVGKLVTVLSALRVGTSDGRDEGSEIAVGFEDGCTGFELVVASALESKTAFGNNHTRDLSEYPTSVNEGPTCESHALQDWLYK